MYNSSKCMVDMSKICQYLKLCPESSHYAQLCSYVWLPLCSASCQHNSPRLSITTLPIIHARGLWNCTNYYLGYQDPGSLPSLNMGHIKRLSNPFPVSCKLLTVCKELTECRYRWLLCSFCPVSLPFTFSDVTYMSCPTQLFTLQVKIARWKA